LVWTQVTLVVFVLLYLRYYEQGDIGLDRRSKISASTLCPVAAALVVTWGIAFYFFIKRINPEYLHTFFGTMTGAQYTVHLFRTGGTEAVKAGIFSVSPLLWWSIRDEVKAWTLANWERWLKEKPAWFTDGFISTVPTDFIPVPMDRNRRKSSLLGNLFSRSDPTGKSGEKGRLSSKVAAVVTEGGEKGAVSAA
jgi:hypothetical protein